MNALLTVEILAASAQALPAAAAAGTAADAETVLSEADISSRRCVKQIQRSMRKLCSPRHLPPRLLMSAVIKTGDVTIG